MTSIINAEAIMPNSEARRSQLELRNKQVTYIEHPYRFVAFGIFTLLNVIGGTFMNAFTPLEKLFLEVNLLGLWAN